MVVAFYLLVALFAFIGSMRGWGKEVLVSFSVILALALISVIEDLLPYTKELYQGDALVQFWVRSSILLLLVFFGYQSPKLSQLSKASEKRDRVQDLILGFIFGAINGYLIFGTLWFFMHEANYPFTPHITSPETDPVTREVAYRLLGAFPPALLTSFWIYVAVVLAFIFVMVVFI